MFTCGTLEKMIQVSLFLQLLVLFLINFFNVNIIPFLNGMIKRLMTVRFYFMYWFIHFYLLFFIYEFA